MMSLDQSELFLFVENNISSFHQRRLEKLKLLKLDLIIRRKNPYLFKAKAIVTAQDYIKVVVDAFLSSQEETVFGEFLEQLAIYVSERTLGGQKAPSEGIDLLLQKDGKVFLIAIKSGPNWGNSSQIKKMVDNFKKAQKILRTNNQKAQSVCINGCCYGKESITDKGDYFKICGQDFWTFISDDPKLYLEIVEPIGYKAREKNDLFYEEYGRIINTFTQQFLDEYCVNGVIDWEKIVKFNSSSVLKKGGLVEYN